MHKSSTASQQSFSQYYFFASFFVFFPPPLFLWKLSVIIHRSTAAKRDGREQKTTRPKSLPKTDEHKNALHSSSLSLVVPTSLLPVDRWLTDFFWHQTYKRIHFAIHLQQQSHQIFFLFFFSSSPSLAYTERINGVPYDDNNNTISAPLRSSKRAGWKERCGLFITTSGQPFWQLEWEAVLMDSMSPVGFGHKTGTDYTPE